MVISCAELLNGDQRWIGRGVHYWSVADILTGQMQHELALIIDIDEVLGLANLLIVHRNGDRTIQLGVARGPEDGQPHEDPEYENKWTDTVMKRLV